MSKFLLLAAVMGLCLVGCNKNRDAEARAYSAGCVAGIDAVLGSLGLQPKEDMIKDHCDKEAQEYLKNNK